MKTSTLKTSTKKEMNAKRAQRFVDEMQNHTGKTMAELARDIGMVDFSAPAKDCVRLAGWRAGKGKNVSADVIQTFARKAVAAGLLPLLDNQQIKGLKRKDRFCIGDGLPRATELNDAALIQLNNFDVAKRRAIEALGAYSAAIQNAKDWLILDTEKCTEDREDGESFMCATEVHHTEILELAGLIQNHGAIGI